MSTRRALLRLAGAAPLAALAIPGVRAQPSEGRDILDRVEKLLWGSTVQGEYEMTIARSPSLMRCAAAPLMLMTPDPRSPGIAYVVRRAPFVISTTSTSWPGRISAPSRRSASIVMEPT